MLVVVDALACFCVDETKYKPQVTHNAKTNAKIEIFLIPVLISFSLNIFYNNSRLFANYNLLSVSFFQISNPTGALIRFNEIIF